jgi:hypothetical protein
MDHGRQTMARLGGDSSFIVHGLSSIVCPSLTRHGLRFPVYGLTGNDFIPLVLKAQEDSPSSFYLQASASSPPDQLST